MKALNLLRLDQIRTDGGTQSRVSMNQPTIAEYAELLTDGVAMPPVIVYHDGADFWLAAGFHRYFAHKQVGLVDINCEVRAGSLDEARLCGARDNNSHGLAPNNGDKAKSVTMALANPLCAYWGARKLAKELGVSHTLVQRIKDSLEPAASDKSLQVATLASCNNPSAPAPVAAAPAGASEDRQAHDPEPTPAARTVPVSAATAPEAPADEHDDSMATQAELLEQLQAEVETLQAQLKAATADDKAAEIVKWRKAYDHANRQFSEAQDRAKESSDREAWTMRQLRRCGKAIGVDDPKNIAPSVEALGRKVKVAA